MTNRSVTKDEGNWVTEARRIEEGTEDGVKELFDGQGGDVRDILDEDELARVGEGVIGRAGGGERVVGR